MSERSERERAAEEARGGRRPQGRAASDTMYRAVFRCAARAETGCDTALALEEIDYRCPTCAGLLEVVHDLAPLRERSGEEWRALLDRRWGATGGLYDSGVWGKHELVAPQLRAENVVSLHE